MVCLCALADTVHSHRWVESSALPDIAADLQNIQEALGIAAQQNIDFILIRDDMVAREVKLPHHNSDDVLHQVSRD